MPLILHVKAGLQVARVISGASHGKIASGRKAEQKVAKSVASKFILVKRKQAVIVRWRLDLGHRETHPAEIHASANRVTAFREGNVVGKLIGARIGGPDVISSN